MVVLEQETQGQLSFVMLSRRIGVLQSTTVAASR